jgi:ribose transport system ATP-binding protein
MSLSVRFNHIVKDFGPVRVLHGVDFALEAGRVVGLLGENGAGKSTLMKILAGYERPSGGQLMVDGTERHFTDARDAEALGIALIHQEFNLAEHLSIAQNIFLGHEKTRGGCWTGARWRARRLPVSSRWDSRSIRKPGSPT